MTDTAPDLPDLDLRPEALRRIAERLQPYVLRTPTVNVDASALLGADMDLHIKLEVLQRTGSFKPRGALNTLLSCDPLPEGVTAFSAGNHAIATAFAASTLGVSAKVVMPHSANAFRVARCRDYGAEIVFGDDIAALMAIVEQLQKDEGRLLIHPFEGPRTVEGTATVGLELCDDVAELDAVVVPVGGGGLIAGVAAAVKQCQPGCRVIGVEPSGACGMSDSLAKGAPLSQVSVNTIADSLGAPMHTPLTFSVVQQYVDDVVQVSDDDMRDGMRRAFHSLKLAVEPACAAGIAALAGPLKSSLHAQRVGLVACGTNIDLATWSRMIS